MSLNCQSLIYNKAYEIKLTPSHVPYSEHLVSAAVLAEHGDAPAKKNGYSK